MSEQRRSRRTVFEGRIIDVYVDEVLTADGHVGEREVVEHPGAVGVVCVHDGDLVLVRQHRYATGVDMLELPAGLLEPGESPEETAVRETIEEVGLRPRTLEHLVTYHTTPGFSNERFHVYLSEDLEEAARVDHPGEVLTVERRAVTELDDLLRSGEVTNAGCLIGLALYALRTREGGRSEGGR